MPHSVRNNVRQIKDQNEVVHAVWRWKRRTILCRLIQQLLLILAPFRPSCCCFVISLSWVHERPCLIIVPFFVNQDLVGCYAEQEVG